MTVEHYDSPNCGGAVIPAPDTLQTAFDYLGDATWDGWPARCDCGAKNAEYLRDVDHDGGSCEVFRCRECGVSFHVELPD